MTSVVAPIIVIAFVLGALAIAIGAKDFGKKLIIGAILLGALVPTLLTCVAWVLHVVVPVLVKVVLWGVGGLAVGAVGLAAWRYWHHRHELRTWKPRQELSPKRRVERE